MNLDVFYTVQLTCCMAQCVCVCIPRPPNYLHLDVRLWCFNAFWIHAHMCMDAPSLTWMHDTLRTCMLAFRSEYICTMRYVRVYARIHAEKHCVCECIHLLLCLDLHEMFSPSWVLLIVACVCVCVCVRVRLFACMNENFKSFLPCDVSCSCTHVCVVRTCVSTCVHMWA